MVFGFGLAIEKSEETIYLNIDKPRSDHESFAVDLNVGWPALIKENFFRIKNLAIFHPQILKNCSS